MSYQRLGRRNRDSSWQWMVIGIFLGMGCSLVMLLSANLFGFVEFSTSDDPTEAAVVISSPAGPTMTMGPTITRDIGAQATGPADSRTVEPSPTRGTPPPTFTPDPNQGTPTSLPGAGSGSNNDPKFGDSGSSGSGSGDTATEPVGTLAEPTQAAVGLPTSSVPNNLAVVASPLIDIPSGTFTMGTTQDEGRAAVAQCIEQGASCEESFVIDSTIPHEVFLDAFKIERAEVSVSQYVAYLNYLLTTGEYERPHLSACNGPCALTTSDDGGEYSDIDFDGQQYSARGAGTSVDRSNYPVTLVTWYGARSYCQELSRDLPTEAQWERAARGPNNTIYPWGQQWDAQFANTNRSSYDPNNPGLAPVDAYGTGANAWGVLNMAGNVAEWTLDWYSQNYYAQSEAQNPRGPASGEKKVVRGGSWDNPPFFARSVHRVDLWGVQDLSLAVGFRCVEN